MTCVHVDTSSNDVQSDTPSLPAAISPKSAPKRPVPVPLFLRRKPSVQKHDRSFSAVSTFTDREICAVAELMSPVIVDLRDQLQEDQEKGNTPLDEGFDSLLEPYFDREPDSPGLISIAGSHTTPGSDISSCPPLSPSSNTTSTYSESEPDCPLDEQPERGYASYPSTPAVAPYIPFHLPRSRPRAIYSSSSDCDTPILTPSASCSSLSSASRSQHRRSTPVTPVTQSMTTSLELASSCSPHLAIIEERNAEDYEIVISPRSPDSPTAISFATTETANDPEMHRSKTRISNLGGSSLKATAPPPSPAFSSTFSSTSGTASPPPQSPRSITSHRTGSSMSLARFLPGSKKDSTGPETPGKSSWTRSQTDLATSDKSFILDKKSLKAEEKKKKKAEAKARTEKLAADLKSRARERASAVDKQSTHSSRSTEHERKRGRGDEVAMYGGLATVF